MIGAKDATKLAQQVLAKGNAAFLVDGWWGTFTNAAFTAASPDVQAAIRVILKSSGTSPEQLLAESRVVSAKASSQGAGWLAEDYVDALIDRVCARQNGDPVLMKRFLRLEALHTVVDGVTLFNARSSSPGKGTYKGLFQMGPKAWADARMVLKDLPDFGAAYDPEQNTRAAVAYVGKLQTYARGEGYKGAFTPEVLYSLHNQGAGGFMKLLRGRQWTEEAASQSRDAKRVIATALAQNGVSLA